jgi:hypothetical protein
VFNRSESAENVRYKNSGNRSGDLGFLNDLFSGLLGGRADAGSYDLGESIGGGIAGLVTDSGPSYVDTSEPEWHNAFGTAADYQVPAESCSSYMSDDWTSSPSGCDTGGGVSNFD